MTIRHRPYRDRQEPYDYTGKNKEHVDTLISGDPHYGGPVGEQGTRDLLLEIYGQAAVDKFNQSGTVPENADPKHVGGTFWQLTKIYGGEEYEEQPQGPPVPIPVIGGVPIEDFWSTLDEHLLKLAQALKG